ncbi:entericidin A/B family lipoprotein [Albidovulum sediminicola]|uniref:Entericidin A/B family lipoprotein n=1 Tax=Albidovulum sediminicola TaxID=2984331 RepID=A0ABT2YWM9_9RHOB|nr:entericidin A/B family lipoprotein [Defluviimonas sp. WL0075]MCV2863240.1 entericidin A/B family lipoprotein [Defluviimonas sp. WL0075]
MTRKTFTALAALSMMVLSACETVKGAGRDMQIAGEAVEGTARDAQY